VQLAILQVPYAYSTYALPFSCIPPKHSSLYTPQLLGYMRCIDSCHTVIKSLSELFAEPFWVGLGLATAAFATTCHIIMPRSPLFASPLPGSVSSVPLTC
jgi:hypothetical protein